MENTEQILRRAQDRKMLEAIFKTIESQKVNVDTSQCSNELVLQDPEPDKSQNNIFNKESTFGQALQIFNLTLDENLISNIRKKKLQYHPDKNNGDYKDIDKFYSLKILSNKAQIIKRYGNSEFATFLTRPLKDISENHLRYIYIYYLEQIDFFGKMELETIFKNTKLLSTKDIEDEFEKQDLECRNLITDYKAFFESIINNQNESINSLKKELKTKIENIKKFIEEIEKFNDKLIKQVITINKICILNEYFFQTSNKKLFPENLNDLNFTEKDSIYMDGLLEYKKLIESNDEKIQIFNGLIKDIESIKLQNKKKSDNHTANIFTNIISLIYAKINCFLQIINPNNKERLFSDNTNPYEISKETEIEQEKTETNKKKETKISFKEHINNINFIKINDALQGQHNIIYALDITIDNLTNTLQQQVQKAHEAQAATEQAQAATEQERAAKEQALARNDRVLKRNSKGDELEDMGQRAQGRLLRRHNSMTATLEQSQEIESLVRRYFPDEILTLLHIQSNQANEQSP